jgi:hypothetical protein
MKQVILIGVSAGTAAALMFGSVTSGVGLSVLLFYLAPLPIMIAALGWSHWAGLTAAVAAAALLGGAFGMSFLATFLASVGAPAWWLGYLALLGRPVANGGSAHMEWYPPGRLVLWAAAVGATVVVGALATFGGDEATIRHGLRNALEQIFRAQTGAPEDAAFQFPGIQDDHRLVEMLVSVLPPAAAVIAAMTLTVNLWLAGHAVKLSGRLRRPWPDLNAVSFPPLAVASYGALLAGAFLPGLAGLIAGMFAATLTVSFAIIGFAVLHTATRDTRGRAVVLSGAYGCVVLIWPVVVVTLVGVAETLFGLRRRLPQRGPPATRNP